MLVDDEPDSVEPMKVLLQEDYDVLIAYSGKEALQILETNSVEILITDQRMPEMSGVDLLVEVREKYPHIVCIMLTAYAAGTEILLRAINEANVFRFMMKPWGVDSLQTTIRDALEFKDTCHRQDMAHRKLEAAMEERTKQLEASNRALQQFAYAASHDLREPLNKIKGFGERLCQKNGHQLDEKGHEYLTVMLTATERMTHLIDNLLSYARAGRETTPLTAVDLGQVLREALSDLDLRIQETKADIQIEDLPTVRAHSMQIRQVFFNLISNALKFRHSKRPLVINIKGTVDKSDAVVAIQDNGIGFDSKHAEKIFEVFSRLHTRFDYPGTGIGLALCRRLLDQYGATIEAHGKPNVGAIFTIRIPLTPESHDE